MKETLAEISRVIWKLNTPYMKKDLTDEEVDEWIRQASEISKKYNRNTPEGWYAIEYQLLVMKAIERFQR